MRAFERSSFSAIPTWPRFFRAALHCLGVFLVIALWALWYFSPADNDHLLGLSGGIWALTQVLAGLITWRFNL